MSLVADTYKQLRAAGVSGIIQVDEKALNWDVGAAMQEVYEISIYPRGLWTNNSDHNFHSHSKPTMAAAVELALKWWAQQPCVTAMERDFYANAEKDCAQLAALAAPGRGVEGLLADVANPGPVCAALAANVTRPEPRAMPILLSPGASQLDIRRACESACEFGEDAAG